jgi:hypothetical protein
MQTEQRQKIPILQNQEVVFSKNYLPLARINIKRAFACFGETASHRIERFIYKLWQMSEVHISSPA